jgi:hypothetical protein
MRPARRRHRGKAGTGYQHKGTGKGVLRTGCGRTVTSLYALRRPPGASGSTVARPVNGPWPACRVPAAGGPCITCTGRMACQCKAYISIQLILYVPRMQMQCKAYISLHSLVTLTYVLLFREAQRPAGKATATQGSKAFATYTPASMDATMMPTGHWWQCTRYIEYSSPSTHHGTCLRAVTGEMHACERRQCMFSPGPPLV